MRRQTSNHLANSNGNEQNPFDPANAVRDSMAVGFSQSKPQINFEVTSKHGWMNVDPVPHSKQDMTFDVVDPEGFDENFEKMVREQEA